MCRERAIPRRRTAEEGAAAGFPVTQDVNGYQQEGFGPFTDVHVISTAMADRLVEVLGPARGIGARATIGVQSLAGNHCYES